jgi:hypothetical protein
VRKEEQKNEGSDRRGFFRGGAAQDNEFFWLIFFALPPCRRESHFLSVPLCPIQLLTSALFASGCRHIRL